MKQFNVREETHKLGRLLSLKTGKSVIVVVQEALELYEKKLDGSEVESNLLQRAADVIVKRMSRVVREEVPFAIGEFERLQEEMRQQQAKELEQALRESTPEAPEDDLEEVTYEEIYGEGQAPGIPEEQE